MSQVSNQMVKSFAANQSVAAYTVVTRSATTTMAVNTWNTLSANILGVAADNVSTNNSLPVIISGSAKCICSASVSAGSIVGPVTTASFIGYIAERTQPFTVTSAYKILGVALEAGSTNSVIEVLLQPSQVSGT